MFDAEKKSQYWNHFTDEARRSFRPKKITDIRLKQIKEIVLNDDLLWQKVISRHHALDITPIELKETSPSNYNQVRANFWAMIRGKIHCHLAQSTEQSGNPGEIKGEKYL
jgi:hypothetical protein